MKKAYTKPSFTFFELRPEERLAACLYYEGWIVGSGCRDRLFVDWLPQYCYDEASLASS